mgnify:CR=1 FL=1
MEITYKHINSNKLPNEIIKSIDLMEALNAELRNVLESELQSGNSISDVFTGFPDKDSVRVALSKPFHKKYPSKNLSYCEETDPHYNSAGYSTGSPVNSITAPFS